MSAPPIAPNQIQRFAWGGWMVMGLLVLLISAKLQMIGSYGSDVPFGDQWSGEGLNLYGPWLHHTLGLRQLLAPHNEHRILWTRLLDLAVLAVNGQWDSRVLLVVNLVFLVAAWAMVLLLVRRILSAGAWVTSAWLVAVLVTSTSTWENTLSAFQSQLYLLLLLSLWQIVGGLCCRTKSAGWWVAQGVGLANLFTMAAGLLAPLAVIAGLAYRRWRLGTREPQQRAQMAWNAILFLLGLCLVPSRTGMDWESAPAAFAHILSWPWVQGPAVVLVYAPLALYAVYRWRRPDGSAPIVLALAIWVLLQGAALAVARGGIASRYVDLLLIGVVVNLLCWSELPAKGRTEKIRLVLAVCWAAMVAHEVWVQDRLQDEITLQHQAALNRLRVEAVRTWIDERRLEPLCEVEGWSEHLGSIYGAWLDEPAVRAVLPVSLRSPVALEVESAEGVVEGDVPKIEEDVPGLPVWGNWQNPGQARWRSRVTRAQLPYLTVFVAGTLGGNRSHLWLETAQGVRIDPETTGVVFATDRWKRVNFLNPGEPFRVVAEVTRGSLAFSAPLETGRLTRWVGKPLNSAGALELIGWTLVSVATLVGGICWWRAPVPRDESE